MRLFGLEIGFAKSDAQKQKELGDMVANLLYGSGAHWTAPAPNHGGSAVQTISRAPHPVEQIVFPACLDPNDPWERARHAKLVKDTEAMFNRGSFSICHVRDTLREFKLSVTPSTDRCMHRLAIIHCVPFREIEPAIWIQIVPMMTHIFSEGRIPLPWDAQPEMPKDNYQFGDHLIAMNEAAGL